RDRAARSGSSFYYSFLFLPTPQRRAITALYAFCREVDDVVDESLDPIVARTKLDGWRREITALFSGSPQHPISRALQPAIADYALPESAFHEIIDGMQMDLDWNRYPDFATLEVYCHRVAGVVGLLSAEIFGYTDPSTRGYARSLGIALQLTNIVRDVGEDARRNRIYLPLDEMTDAGVTTDDIILFRETPAVAQLIQHQIRRACTWYDRAYALLPAGDRRRQRAGLVMGAIYRRLLGELEREGARVMNRRVSLTPLRKLWIAWRTWKTA
ncbi:MAG: presqualene diphosphate synthase HpnD, partial [Burkholderiales bacterium]|nr:presqualene diphosphate synthase HpnD [Burkholderiales bacterium]